jgi:hypothetical protein
VASWIAHALFVIAIIFLEMESISGFSFDSTIQKLHAKVELRRISVNEGIEVEPESQGAAENY